MNRTRLWPRSPVLVLVDPRRALASPRLAVAAGTLSPQQAYRWGRERRRLSPAGLRQRLAGQQN